MNDPWFDPWGFAIAVGIFTLALLAVAGQVQREWRSGDEQTRCDLIFLAVFTAVLTLLATCL